MNIEITTLLNERINPVLAQHKGSCELVSVENGVVCLKLLDGCIGCPGRRATLLNGIKPFIQQNFPEVLDVVLVD